jgi:hypothetical protein
MNTIRKWEIAVFAIFVVTAFWFFNQFGGAPAEKEIVEGRYLIHPKGKWVPTEVSGLMYYTYSIFEWVFIPYFIYFLWKYFGIIRNSLRGGE